jgi:ankyrin repeat protein
MYSDHSNILNLFFEYGAVDQRLSLEDRTLLMQASSMGLTCYVEFLLAKGADVNATDFRGANPLIFAIANSKIDVAEVLIRYGADINPIFALDRTKYINYVPFLKGYIEANQDKLTPENLRKYKAYRLQAILS